MAASDPNEILLAHDLWATKQILTTCEALSEEQLNRKFEMGPGSVFRRLVHIIGAIRGWTDSLNGSEPRSRPETDGVQRNIADLLKLLEESHAEFDQAIKSNRSQKRLPEAARVEL